MVAYGWTKALFRNWLPVIEALKLSKLRTTIDK